MLLQRVGIERHPLVKLLFRPIQALCIIFAESPPAGVHTGMRALAARLGTGHHLQFPKGSM